MYYAYVIKSLKSKRLYYGFSSNLKERVLQHNQKMGGTYTSKNAPFELIYYEAYKAKKDATAAEQFLKSGYGREILKNKLKYSLG